MFKNNIYNIDREFDYPTIKGLVIQPLEKIVKREALKNASNISQRVIFNSHDSDDPNNVNDMLSTRAPLLKLKIRNTTQYLNWRIAVLKRDGFRCHICGTSMKDNKRLRLEVHHAKAFNDICIENCVSTIEQALECKELWNVNNGVSICYRCHKDVEQLRTRLRQD